MTMVHLKSKHELQALIDYHDNQESEADAVGATECAKRSHNRRLELQSILALWGDPNAPFRWICIHCNTVSGINDQVCLGCRKPRYPLTASMEGDVHGT